MITPADETIRSPWTYLRYLRGTTGTGLAPPKVNRPARGKPQQRRQQHGHPRIDVRQRIQRHPAQHVGRVVALPERRPRMGVLVRHEREQQDRAGRG